MSLTPGHGQNDQTAQFFLTTALSSDGHLRVTSVNINSEQQVALSGLPRRAPTASITWDFSQLLSAPSPPSGRAIFR